MLFLCSEIAETDKSTFPSRRNIRVREVQKLWKNIQRVLKKAGRFAESCKAPCKKPAKYLVKNLQGTLLKIYKPIYKS